MECAIHMGPTIFPRLVHDCDKCTFIGWVTYRNVRYDVYRTCEGNHGDVLLRYGNQGPDYMSMCRDVCKRMGDHYLTAVLMIEMHEALTTLATEVAN